MPKLCCVIFDLKGHLHGIIWFIIHCTQFFFSYTRLFLYSIAKYQISKCQWKSLFMNKHTKTGKMFECAEKIKYTYSHIICWKLKQKLDTNDTWPDFINYQSIPKMMCLLHQTCMHTIFFCLRPYRCTREIDMCYIAIFLCMHLKFALCQCQLAFISHNIISLICEYLPECAVNMLMSL